MDVARRRDGEGVEQDYEKAFEYTLLAAEQGHPKSCYNIGWSYEQGEGVEQDYDEALKYYKLASEYGNNAGTFAVGELYYLGLGVDQDLEEAAKWYLQALDEGYEPDEEDRKHLKEVLGEDAAPQTELETEQESTLVRRADDK